MFLFLLQVCYVSFLSDRWSHCCVGVAERVTVCLSALKATRHYYLVGFASQVNPQPKLRPWLRYWNIWQIAGRGQGQSLSITAIYNFWKKSKLSIDGNFVSKKYFKANFMKALWLLWHNLVCLCIMQIIAI